MEFEGKLTKYMQPGLCMRSTKNSGTVVATASWTGWPHFCSTGPDPAYIPIYHGNYGKSML
jgi:hypothetical protein